MSVEPEWHRLEWWNEIEIEKYSNSIGVFLNYVNERLELYSTKKCKYQHNQVYYSGSNLQTNKIKTNLNMCKQV